VKCFDEVTLHGYLDGELSAGMRERLAAHIISCDACAKALGNAEAEKNIIAKAFVCAEPISVPSARLRANINSAVSRQPSAARARASFPRISFLLNLLNTRGNSSAPLLKPMFASLIVALAVVAIVVILMKLNVPPNEVADTGSSPRLGLPVEITDPQIEQMLKGDTQAHERQVTESAETNHSDVGDEVKPVRAGGSDERQLAKLVATSNLTPKFHDKRNNHGAHVAAARNRFVRPPKAALLPGEETYLEAIASLKTALEMNGESALPTSVRNAYERNMEVIDEAIVATRRTAATDPEDVVAANFLREAYESKLLLLGSLATQMDANRR
jgi:anti-sigma factor RsiW